MPRRGPPIILNVDDSEVARYAKNRTLRHAGFEVVDAETGTQALAAMERLRAALVLLDVHLPDISGIEVCRVIKQRWPTTMVLQTSATYTSTADRVRGLEGGADAYLIQPIDPDELVAAVRALLRLHAAESATRELNETLEQRIRERTDELRAAHARLVGEMLQRERAELALTHAQKLEAVGHLTGAIAHDFNNLLAGLTGYLHLIHRTAQEPETRQHAEKALAAAERGSRLTRRLLSFSRAERLQTWVTDVREIILGMQDWLAQSAGNRVELRVSVHDEESLARTDASELELALLNMVLNSRDAMPEGGTVWIAARRERLTEAHDDLAPGDYVVVEVADTGSGMPPHVAAQAFDPFYTTKPSGHGTGLGLAQVRDLARRSGGAARLTSTPGAGTSIALWLPAARAGEATQAHGRPERVVPGLGERVLLVDDDEHVLHSTAGMLAGIGYRVRTARNSDDALAAFLQDRPELVLLDIDMPGRGGAEIARQMRAVAPAQRLLFISGHGDTDALELATGGGLLMRKPFTEAELSVAVRRCLEREGC